MNVLKCTCEIRYTALTVQRIWVITTWFNTPEGPFAVTQEAGLRKLTITNLKTGGKVIAFERMLGINGFSVDRNAEGVISISASLGFFSENIPDALAFFKSNLLTQQANNAEG